MKQCREADCEREVYHNTNMCRECFLAYEKARRQTVKARTQARVKVIKQDQLEDKLEHGDRAKCYKEFVHPRDRSGVFEPRRMANGKLRRKKQKRKSKAKPKGLVQLNRK